MPYVLVLYYSRYGATKELANYIARGINSIDGIEARIRTVPNVSPNTEKSEPEIPKDGAPFVTLEDLENASGYAIGSPTRFGNMAAPLKYFIDQTSSLWMSGKLINKPACFFSSSASLHGGQETTLISMMFPFIHQGAIIVGLPYSEKDLTTTTTGGTPYGVTHVAGEKSNNPISNEEKNLSIAQGKRIATITLKLLS